MKTATLCTLLILPPGMVVAYILARKSFPGKVILEALVHAPLVLPPVVTGWLLLEGLGRNSALGSFLTSLGLPVSFTWFGAVVAAAITAFPLFVRGFRPALELVDPKLETAAALLGAPPWRVFLSITLPLSLPGLISGMVLAFVRGLGEFGATMTFAGNIPGETQTLPLAVYSYMQVPGGERAVTWLALAAIALSLLALILSEWSVRKTRAKMGNLS